MENGFKQKIESKHLLELFLFLKTSQYYCDKDLYVMEYRKNLFPFNTKSKIFFI